MEKKATVISLIFVCAIVLSAVAYIIFAGITANEYNYVLLEINPKVEFLCDKNYKVVSVNPVNDDARIVLANENYKGMDITKATTSFVDTCAKMGYIDVDGEDNAINITIIDGITQALDVHVTQGIYNYLRKNEILCAVVENYEDRHMFDEKKKNNVCCANKFKLMQTMQTYLPEYEIKSLSKLSEVELIDIVNDVHIDKKYSPTSEEKSLKESMLGTNKEKYEFHKSKITNETQREFANKFDKYQKTTAQNYMTNFGKYYKSWQDKHVS